MEISMAFFISEINNDSQNDQILQLMRIRRQLRDSSNPFSLPDVNFFSYFRINKDGMRYIVDTLAPHFKPLKRTSAVPPLLKVCATLRFLAAGSYQTCSGNDFNVGLAQPTFSLILEEVLQLIEAKLANQWISAALTVEEMVKSKLDVFEKSGFPGVVGFVDGTHVKIVSPREEEQHLYLNRKGYYSLNVMIFCDHKMKIRYVDARFPGANHDSHVWNISALKEHFSRTLPSNTWILGDSGYPLQADLMTPFRSTSEGSPEAKYNKNHCKARNTVERTIGVLKSKFRCLLSARGLHYKPLKATRIVNACCVLHNICKHFNVIDDDIERVEDGDDVLRGDAGVENIAAERNFFVF